MPTRQAQVVGPTQVPMGGGTGAGAGAGGVGGPVHLQTFTLPGYLPFAYSGPTWAGLTSVSVHV